MTAVTDLPWDKPFSAHIINQFVFARVLNDSHTTDDFFPQAPMLDTGHHKITWRLPDAPPTGLTMLHTWKDVQLPACLIATKPDSQKWLLGRSIAGVPLHVAGSVNIYGRQDTVANWLVHQVTHMVRINHSNLVVLDGEGDLVPQLKRKAAVTRLLGEQLTYIDFDSHSQAGGFNPLAPVAGETEKNTMQRWQCWFQGMDAHPEGVRLLARARKEGVADIPELCKWLKQVERREQNTAVSSLRILLNRLTAHRRIRERLEWPTNCFDILPAGALFFSCRGNSWDRQQLLRAALLGAQAIADARIIIHGFPFVLWDEPELFYHNKAVISNGPTVNGRSIVLTESHAKGIATLANRFLENDKLLVENLELLGQGGSMILVENNCFFSAWHNMRGQ